MSDDLSALFQLPPEKAIAYLESKGYRLTWNWWEMQRDQHARAFTVAKLARLDILEDIRAAVETALKEGKTERWFRQELEQTLKRKGWWGKAVDVDPTTMEAQLYQAGSPRRLQTIYRTNLQTAYMAGRQRQFDAEIDRAPFVQYIAVMDTKTRPAHAALDGKVFRLDDPAWDIVAPINGWNCRCRARNLSERELERRGLKVQTDVKLLERDAPGKPPVDKRTGETPAEWKQRGISIPDPMRPGERITFYPDVGWDYNPGRSAPWGDLDLSNKARATLPEQQAAEALREHAVSPARLAAFSDWVDQVFSQGASRGLEWVIGYLGVSEIEALIARGGAVANGAIVLEDRLLVGPKAARHALAGNALSAEEWKAVPALLVEPEAVLYDKVNGTLLYVLPSKDGRKTKIVVEGGRVERKRGAFESVRTGFKVKASDLLGKQFELLSGRLG